MPDKNNIIKKTKQYVQNTLQNDCTGHDWWHVYRVWKNSLYIAEREQADTFKVQLIALLHDIADWKFNGGDITAGTKAAKEWLSTLKIDQADIEEISKAIESISFKGANVVEKNLSLEAKIVQDADRLDAIGAIGIGRTFAYGGYKGRPMYDPNIEPTLHNSFEAYKNNQGTTINHFYEKLLLLKDRMNTDTGRCLAEQRHRVMEDFVQKFKSEWFAEIANLPLERS